MNQAERVIEAFGGVQKLSGLLALVGRGKSVPAILRWTYPRERRGTGGFIPSSAWDDLFAVARLTGVELTAELLDPRPAAQPIGELELDPSL